MKVETRARREERGDEQDQRRGKIREKTGGKEEGGGRKELMRARR